MIYGNALTMPTCERYLRVKSDRLKRLEDKIPEILEVTSEEWDQLTDALNRAELQVEIDDIEKERRCPRK